MSFKKIAGYLHLWLGITSGLVVFIVSLTGAILTFEEEVDYYLINPEFYFVKNTGQQQLPVDTLMAIASPELLKLEHGSRASRIFLYNDPERSAIVGYNIEENDLVKWPYTRGHVFLNPYTGEILGKRSGNPHHPVWMTITSLHYDLLLGDFGNFMVTWGTMVFLLLVISGIVLWWPKNKTALKQRYKFSWKETTRWRRKNYDLHNILGFYASWILIFMILTGLMWSFEWFNQGVYFVTSGGEFIRTNTELTKPVEKDHLYVSSFGMYAHALEAFKHKYPEQYERSMEVCIGYFANDQDSLLDVSASFDAKGIRVNKAIWANYDKTTGLMTTTDSDDEIRNFGDAVQQSTNELHYGSFFGWPSRIATFFACLVAASLPVTGLLVWLGKRKKNNRR